MAMVVQIDRQKERMATLMIFDTRATHFLLPLLKNAEFVGEICRVQKPLVNASQQCRVVVVDQNHVE